MRFNMFFHSLCFIQVMWMENRFHRLLLYKINSLFTLRSPLNWNYVSYLLSRNSLKMSSDIYSQRISICGHASKIYRHQMRMHWLTLVFMYSPVISWRNITFICSHIRPLHGNNIISLCLIFLHCKPNSISIFNFLVILSNWSKPVLTHN